MCSALRPITIAGSSFGDPFTHVSVYGQVTSATSTLRAFTGSPFSIVASSTVNFVNASTTNLTIFTGGSLYLPSIGNYQLLETNGAGAIIATTSIGASFLSGAVAVANGGTASTTLGGLLSGNGTSQLTSAIVSAPLSFSANTLSISQANGSTNGFLASGRLDDL
jgi:hypothetical protein